MLRCPCGCAVVLDDRRAPLNEVDDVMLRCQYECAIVLDDRRASPNEVDHVILSEVSV